MKRITLDAAFEILEECSAVIMEGYNLMYPGLFDLTGEDDNVFLYLNFADDKGQEYSIKFNEKNNKTVRVDRFYMYFFDIEGDEVQLTILDRKNIE
jgi:hypothetical protein